MQSGVGTGEAVVGLLAARGIHACVQLSLELVQLGFGAEQGGEGVEHVFEGAFVARAVFAVLGERALLGEDAQRFALGEVDVALGGLMII